MTNIKITKTMAQDILDYYDNWNDDICKDRHIKAFRKLRKKLEDLK